MGRKVIQVNNLSKSYRIRRESKARYMTFRDEIYHFGKSIFKKKEKSELFWALKDISFEVEQGEILGVIGRNGAGKSTLLKILSRITAPTSGEVIIEGRLGSLLEVGTGFHLELTGKENIFLGGSVLGLKQSEIKSKFDEIVSFAGVEAFIDTPVKRYSTGMRVRLGFAIAAHLEPEILLIDEVLAVGDLEFQEKCLGKMDEVAKTGRTVLFVSHNLGMVKQICSKGLLLTKGEVGNIDEIETVIDHYTKASQAFFNESGFTGPLASKVKLKSIKINEKVAAGEAIYLSQFEQIRVEVNLVITKLKPFRVTLGVFHEGVRIFSMHDAEATYTPPGEILSYFLIPGKILRPGLYYIAVGGLEKNEFGDWFWQNDVTAFTITENWGNGIEAINHGLINVIGETFRIIK